MHVQVVRWGGLICGVVTGVALIIAGDLQTGVGLIGASLSSASVLKT